MKLTQAQRYALWEIERSIPSGSWIAEIGFGKGEFLEHLLKRGYKVIGTETSEKMVEQGKQVFSQRRRNVSLIQTENPGVLEFMRLEAVVCFEVVEHLEDPLPFLKSFPSGYCYFSTPNKNRWWVKLTGTYDAWDYPPNHMKRYGLEDFFELLQEAGFREISVCSLPIRYDEILQPIYTWLAFKLGLRKNTSDYETVRGEDGILSATMSTVRFLSWPLAFPIASVLNFFGLKSTNLLAEAVKE